MADTLYKQPEDYLLQAITRLSELGSSITDFTTGGAARTFFEGVGAMLSTQSATAEQLRQDSYLSTASGDALDAKASDFQVTRNAAVPANGVIRISRSNPADTTVVTIPAGWSTLLTVPQSGLQPVAFITTADANFTAVDAHIDVAAQAVEGGTTGNVPINTVLLPQNPVNGFDTTAGFVAHIAFTGGVDVESDDALRARVPIEVQGRVKGKPQSLLAGALAVPGVTSAIVLEAGDTRSTGGTVAAGHCEVYYQGDASLLSAVASGCENARVAGQEINVFQAAALELVVKPTVYCLAGVDTVALAAAVQAALIAKLAAVGVGGTVRVSDLVQTIMAVANVATVDVPFADLRTSAETAGTFHNVVAGNVTYPELLAANCVVTVSTL